MRFYTTMPSSLQPFYHEELTQYRSNYQSGDLLQAWRHLERAHIIGQRYPAAHSFVHWKMLQFGIRIKNTKEIIGQVPRLLVGGLKSFVGKVPLGNPGGSNVPALRKVAIAEDIQDIFRKAGVDLK
ncbi:DUF3703 domain-containing protein [Algoriphagus antarcticus]|uniref:Uncharacterized protein DUF3703 n=1 Tax=Algoriphagus antarcticus TaxID=238540 RepID=A0A3E0EBI5_9BACT|nr:DUF3703 domain-containing protein [Algoriphagus antarcticus]REG94366.1 uncharacterized protein DUF3703 [Algoriphagus antarcticus]